MDTDSFVLSFEANQENLIEFLKQNKDQLNFSELDKYNELYDLTRILLDSFTALKSKSYSFPYNNKNIQKAKQKGIQKAPNSEDYKNSLFMSETTNATNYSLCSNLHQSTVQYQNKIPLNPFDDRKMYL